VRRALALAVAWLAFTAAPARATDFFVNTNADPVSPDNACTTNPGGCTLHDAVDDAGPTDVVHVPANTYSLANGGPLQLGGESVVGAGARTTIIDGGGVGNVVVANNTTGNQVSAVTLRNGGGQGQVGGGSGGALLVLSGFAPASLTLLNSTVTGSHGTTGGGIASNGTLVVIGSTITGNTATSGLGGGIVVISGTTTLTNTTISGNAATSAAGGMTQGGGVYVQAGSLTMTSVTIAGSSATVGRGLYRNTSSNPTVTLSHTLVANAPNACSGSPFGGSVNLADDSTCGFGGSPKDPLLGGLANNGGSTDTRALAAGSPAINAGGTCPATDQRGVARPQGGACDIGAYEYRAPLLTVIKRVVNDDKGIEAADDFTVHVRVGAADVAGSPAPGSAGGRTYTLTPGSYSVGEDASEVYAGSFAGDCSATGVVVLGEGQSKTCTITNDDTAPGLRVFNVEPKRGTVRIKLPGRKRFRRLTEGEQLPVGTTVDTLKGRVTIIAASNKTGGTSRADFYDGIFKLGQTRGKRPITTLTLVEKLTGCKAAGKQASAAAKKKRKRRLWGDGKGRFRTRGSHSAATVVGTKWLVEDRCASTLTRVVRGRVKVTDFEKDKSVFVRKGHRYIARAQ
jgi:hypothetical protein